MLTGIAGIFAVIYVAFQRLKPLAMFSNMTSRFFIKIQSKCKMNLYHLYGSKKQKKHDSYIMLFSGYYIWFVYYLISSKVVPCLISPVLKPFLNQYILCSDVPWVKESGTI